MRSYHLLNKKFKYLFILLVLVLLCSLNAPFSRESQKYKSKIIEIAQNIISKNLTSSAASTRDELKSVIKCKNKDFETKIHQHGEHWLVENFVKSEKYFECLDTITYTTHGDVTFFDNIVPLVERWRGPVSIALYTPGDDFYVASLAIAYLRNCHPLVRQLVTFHVFFEAKFIPKHFLNVTFAENSTNCDEDEVYLNVPRNETFKEKSQLAYPINIARNLARTAALTHFVLASDIELYPNPNFIGDFFEMLANFEDKERTLVEERNIFILPLFEIILNTSLPHNKSQLIELFNQHKVFWFHAKICPACHRIPDADRWLNDTHPHEMRVHAKVKRQGDFSIWEPMYVGTNTDPTFDERLNWEGKRNKMTQGYIMCLLDYNYNVLSNGFLVHKPGIKTVKEATRLKLERESRLLVHREILPDIHALYGTREGCKKP